jgi:hypothetical protein
MGSATPTNLTCSPADPSCWRLSALQVRLERVARSVVDFDGLGDKLTRRVFLFIYFNFQRRHLCPPIDLVVNNDDVVEGQV